MNDPKNLLHVRDWNMISYHRPFSVSCFEPDAMNKYHYVFTIPKNLLRDRPIRFNQFKLTDDAQELQKCFLFFLDFIHEMVCTKKKDGLEPGRNSVAFVEWCPRSDAKTVRDIAGWRIHVFVDRQVNELHVLKQYINGFEKKAKKCLQKRLSVPEHFEITSLTRYANDIYAVYSSEECNVQDLYDGIEHGSDALPSALFKAMELGDSVYTLEDYENIDGSFTFPGTEFVRVDPEELSVEKFFKKQLPDYVLFNLVKPEVRVYRDEQRVEFLPHRNYENIEFDFSTLDDFLVLRQKDFVIYEAGKDIDLYDIGELTCSKGLHRGDLWMNRVNFHNLEGKAASVYEECRRNQAELSIIDCIKISSYSQSESERAKYLEEEFLTHVWNDEDCKESEPLKAVIRWFQKEYDHTMLPDPQPLCHHGMSVMGHRATLLMEMKTLLFQVASAHRASYYLEIARLDAFRHEHNMHLNAVFTGDAATSKSFTLKQLIENSIGNTMSMRTYDTDKADAVDSDKDHWVSMFDEAPAGMFHDPKKRGPVEALKMRTTEMKTSHRRLFTDEEGTRLQIESTSSNIGCMFGATNESRSKFDAALQERFHFFEAEKCLTTTRSTEDCQHAAKTMIKENNLEKERWVMFLKFEQGFAAMAWTFIRLGVIKKPDISAYMNVSRRFCTILQKQHGISIPTRTQQRMKLLCQNLAILRAKQIMYFTRTGECKNMPFHPSHLLKAEKYMICTEELAIHAIGLEFDTVVSRNERKLLKKIWEMHKENPTYRLQDKGENDWNYLAVTGNIQSISKKLCNSLQEDHVHVSTCNIETILRDLMDRTLNSHKYQEGGDGFPACTSAMGKYIAADLDGGSLYLHVDLFKEIRQGNSEFNVYKECLAKLAHEYADEKRIILGLTPYDVDEPWRWDFYDTKRKNGKVIEFIQGNGGEIDTYGRVTANANSKITVHSDIDVYAAQQHSMTCGYEIQPYAPHDLHDWQGVKVPYPPRKNKRKR
jgi:hypothetical protein